MISILFFEPFDYNWLCDLVREVIWEDVSAATYAQ
jgi:hypothetical protein